MLNPVVDDWALQVWITGMETEVVRLRTALEHVEHLAEPTMDPEVKLAAIERFVGGILGR